MRIADIHEATLQWARAASDAGEDDLADLAYGAAEWLSEARDAYYERDHQAITATEPADT